MQQIAYEQNDIQVLSGAESNARYASKQVQQRYIGVWSKLHRAKDLLQTYRPSQGSEKATKLYEYRDKGNRPLSRS